MSLSTTRVRIFSVLLLTLIAAACGKKGAPLPPLVRLPAPVESPSVMRLHDEVVVRFIVPSANVDGHKPADIARVEVYAITLERPPLPQFDFDKLRRASKLLTSEVVRRPVPPPPPPKPGEPEPKPLPAEAGVDQGSEIVVREPLTPESRVPVVVEPVKPQREVESDVEPLPGPLVAPTEIPAPMRYYFAVGVGRNGRYGPVQAIMPVPLGETSSAPDKPELTYDETTLTIKWTPAADARGVTPPGEPDVLPSTPTVRGPEATTYDIFEVLPAVNGTPARPIALSEAPIGALELARPVGTFGTERCFFVRPVDILQGLHVRGPASPTVCVTPADTFPPAPPKSLAAVATEGAMNLIWEPSESADIVGYLVLRSRLPDDTLQPTTPEPIVGTTYVDKGVRSGVTYGYVIVAIDKAGNRSEPSNRVEETAR